MISFRSKESRISGLYRLNKLYVNGKDSSIVYEEKYGINSQLSIGIEKSAHPYIYFWSICEEGELVPTCYNNGMWFLSEDKNSIELSIDIGDTFWPFNYKNKAGSFIKIKRLTKDELWLESYYNEKQYVLKYFKIKQYN